MTEYLGTEENRVEYFLQCLRNATEELLEVRNHIDLAAEWMGLGLGSIEAEKSKKSINPKDLRKPADFT